MSRVDLRHHFDDRVGAAEREAMWSAIDARLPQGVTRTAPAARRIRVVQLLAAALTVLVLVVTSWSLRQKSDAVTVAARASLGPLVTKEGASFKEITSAVELDDGSRVSVAQGAKISVLENDALRFVLKQSTGDATYEVTPGGPRRWTVETSLGSIDVIGTGFRVESSETRLFVAVSHGLVVVRGERVPGRVERLAEGQSITVTAAAPEPQPSVPVAALPDVTTAPEPAPRWRELALRGAYEEAYASLGPNGTAGAHASRVADLFTLADVARLSGHPGDAALPLRRVVREHPRDARAPLAAFTLGRLLLDTLGDPRGAAGAFEQAIALGIAEGLREDAHVRCADAWGRAGELERARAAAQRSAERYPATLPKVERWLTPR